MGISFKSPLICLVTSPGTYKIQVFYYLGNYFKLQNDLQKCKRSVVQGPGPAAPGAGPSVCRPAGGGCTNGRAAARGQPRGLCLGAGQLGSRARAATTSHVQPSVLCVCEVQK